MIQLVDHLYRIDRIPLITWGSQLFGHASMRDTRFDTFKFNLSVVKPASSRSSNAISFIRRDIMAALVVHSVEFNCSVNPLFNAEHFDAY